MSLKHFARVGMLLVMVVSLSSWGFLVHRTINQLAIYELPKKMQLFFYKNMDSIVREAPRPDMRRNTDPTEAAKHFIDIEMYGDSAAWKMPLHWNDAVRIYTKDTLLKYGYVPYLIIMEKDRLTQAFRNGNRDSIVFYATDLGHYIGDAHVPLHTSVNYDGQLSNQRGIHSLWESTIPDLSFSQYNLYSSHKARYLSNPEEAIWDAVRHGYSLVKNLFEQEKETTKEFTDSTKYQVQVRRGREFKTYSPAFAKAYAIRLGNTINDQLLHSADLIADCWYTSWVDAGRPDLNALLATPFSKEDKKVLKQQVKAYKNNELIEKKLLISRQVVSSE